MKLIIISILVGIFVGVSLSYIIPAEVTPKEKTTTHDDNNMKIKKAN